MKKLTCAIMLMFLLAPIAMSQQHVDPEWIYRWYYDTEESDQGDAIAVDNVGNIYVTGHTDSSASYDDFITIRLTQAGDTVWTRIYDSPSDGIDDPEFIETDAAGNIYVTGDVGRYSLDWKKDAAVLKYLPNGTLDWAYRYNGPDSLDDRVEGFGLDALGNIYAVGYTQILSGSPGREDYLIIKLLPTGDTAWVRTMQTGNRTFDRLYDIAFDQSNNIYVTGGYTNAGNYDIATIKYDQAGDTLWMRLYGNVSLTDDVPVGIGLDAAGNVYIGGSTYNTTKDVLAIKYDAYGVFQWAASFDGHGADLENPRDMTVDDCGNVYIVGETTDSGQRDILAVKFDNTGTLDWYFQYDAGGLENELVFNHKDIIKADNLGNVFFGGATYYVLSGSTTDALTFKLNANGEIVWYNRYGGPGLDFDQIRAVELDDDNNCYVTGYSEGIYGNWDLFLLKFASPSAPSYGSIAGIVTDASTANPIENVHVVVEGTEVEDSTNISGEYVLPDLEEGFWSVTSTHAAYVETTIICVTVIPDDTTTLDVELTPLGPAYGSIAGVVTDSSTGSPIENVYVSAEGTEVEDTTDVNGEYTLADLEEGTYNVSFSHVSYNDTTVSDIAVEANQTTTLDVELTASAGVEYLPGDANMITGQWPPQIIGSDVTFLVSYFRSAVTPCLLGDPVFFCSGDANGDCQVIGSDVTRLVSYFRGVAAIEWCGNDEFDPESYPPRWLSPGDLPEDAPSGWPNCAAR